MINHDQLRDALELLHDGELGAQERAEVLSHLEGCHECQEVYQRWEQLSGIFFRSLMKPIPAQTEFFVQRVMERLNSSDPAPSVGWWPWLEDHCMVPALSMGLVAALLSILMVRPESIAPTDALFLINSQNHAAAQWVLPPDPANTGMMLLAPEEE